MKAYYQGHSYHYLANAINNLWIAVEDNTMLLRYETKEDGVKLMDIQFYPPQYKPWEYGASFTEAEQNEVVQVLEALQNILRNSAKFLYRYLTTKKVEVC